MRSREIEIAGEATKRLTREMREVRRRTLEENGRMRDKSIHDYLGVDLDAVWETVRRDIPKLKEKTEAVIEKETRQSLDCERKRQTAMPSFKLSRLQEASQGQASPVVQWISEARSLPPPLVARKVRRLCARHAYLENIFILLTLYSCENGMGCPYGQQANRTKSGIC